MTLILKIAVTNHIINDNEAMSLKSGEVKMYTLSDVKIFLDEWQLTKKFDYFIIMHSEDVNPHIHIVLSFDDNSYSPWMIIKNKFPYGYISSCPADEKTVVRYLCHADYCGKTQYPWDSIITNAPDKLEEYKKLPGKTSPDAELQTIINQITA